MWAATDSRGIPLRAILVTVGVVVATYMAGKLLYRLRDTVLVIAVAGFVALLLNPLVVALQRWKLRRRGLAVAVVTFWAVIVFVGLAFAFGYPLVKAITHLANELPAYVNKAQHGKGWIGHLIRRYHVQAWVQKNNAKIVTFGQSLGLLRSPSARARYPCSSPSPPSSSWCCCCSWKARRCAPGCSA